ncbi:hypothetical protein EV180_004834 [Coemansia sp. RSA 518]|nr:hypothetical protein IW142_005353 [Coemansia sp. RSA 564]KAJ2170258.1 hypothetical protein GGF45_005384 [Coemansia sp. RSA 551]KAJ2172859.1 hypothetical protein GGH16_002123 [Coemansia sp. RSA 560]KAJ2203238.1 hypothetical protein IW143_005860 [Coemansia sp. RSA 520]KAJ2220931.1 hypothetical protein EV180_004834 [Coemansia sp. RSA 518]KAJ2272764.1 hypothetical protein GGH14_004566 [Coemansia sp. RSA 370]KAJ2431489.1 hypothetical protein IWW41_002888 [Coemansia sp. RSA 2522]
MNVPEFHMPSEEEHKQWVQDWETVLVGRILEDEPANYSRKQVCGISEEEGDQLITKPLDESVPKPWLYESSDGQQMVKASLIPGCVRTIGPNMPVTLDFRPTRLNISYDEGRRITNVSFC